MKKVYLTYDNGWRDTIFSNKKAAQKHCRKGGYKFNKKQQLYINDREGCYRNIMVENVYEEAE